MEKTGIEKLKRVVIKEELVALTRDYTLAILLNQMIYWSERTKDADKYIREEQKRMKTEGIEANIALTHGWIYKKAEELAEETMMSLSNQTIGRKLDFLIKNQWLDVRHNPEHKYDRTKQYRVNFIKIQVDLHKLGYHLEGYKIDVPNSMMENANSTVENGHSILENHNSKTENQNSMMEEQYQRLQQRSQTETTNKTTTQVPNDVVVEIESALGTSVKTLLPQLKRWVQEYGPDYLIQKAQYVGEQRHKLHNVIGMYRAAVTQNYQTDLTATSESALNKNQNHDRYQDFYALFPDA